MTPRRTPGWAEKVVDKVATADAYVRYGAVVDLVTKEHARSIRLLKAEITRVEMGQHQYNKLDKEVRLEELNIVLAALTKGR